MTKRKRAARSSRAPSRTVQRLRRRLQEAEETLAAIRDGHVEALVVQSPEGERIFTLHSADQPYRLMVEQMQEGALTLSSDGVILYCNSRFAELVALPPERITGQPVSQFVEFDDPSHLAWYSAEDDSTPSGAERKKLLRAREHLSAKIGRAHV